MRHRCEVRGRTAVVTGVAIEGEGGSAQGCAAEVTDEAPIARYASFCNGARYVLDGGQTAS